LDIGWRKWRHAFTSTGVPGGTHPLKRISVWLFEAASPFLA
jgi:hypothetical protein